MEDIKKVKVIQQYEATSEIELSIFEDEILTVSIMDSNEDWYHGCNNEGEEGYFPVAYVRDTQYPPSASEFGSQRNFISFSRENVSHNVRYSTDADPPVNERETFVQTSIRQPPLRFTNSRISKSDQNLAATNKFGSQRSLNSLSSEDHNHNVQKLVKQSPPRPAARKISKSNVNLTSISESDNKLKHFNGTNDKLTIDEWISLYEFGRGQETEEEKVIKLMNYLDEKALSWYAQEVAKKTPPISWNDCKQRMLARFGTNISRPIITAIYRKFQDNDNIEKYYSEKLTLLNQANLPDLDKIALLTDGMPKYYHKSLISTQISTTEQWFTVASQIEALKSNLPKHFPRMTIIEENGTDVSPIPSKDTQPKKWSLF